MSHAALEMSPTARCRKCGYALRGLSTPVCPECGLRFDPADWSSFVDSVAHAARKRAWRVSRWQQIAQPPSYAACGVVVVATIFLLAVTDVALFVLSEEPRNGGDFALGLLRIFAITAVALGVLGRIRAGVARRRLKRSREPVIARSAPRHASRVVWACGIITALMIVASPRFVLDFALHRGTFDALAAAQVQAGTSAAVDRWVGGIHVSNISLHTGGQVVLSIGRPPYGLLYEPRGRLWEMPKRRLLLGGGWSLASFGPAYTLWDLIEEPFPRLAR